MPRERHDNDKADITEINIFPTRAEIMSDAREFLPSTDLDQPHFLTSKLERHIDTHFRLLRHDTVGKLKDALGGVMKNIINDPNQLTNPRPGFGDTRTYTYSNTFDYKLEYPFFNLILSEEDLLRTGANGYDEAMFGQSRSRKLDI
ncbi:MAG: hypothetical protein M1816_005658 [Peltula sp. TS41687]|nr:MAG: hypothetical protein M1816_005658 [Peltula sp. TS41687]